MNNCIRVTTAKTFSRGAISRVTSATDVDSYRYEQVMILTINNDHSLLTDCVDVMAAVALQH